MEDYIKTTCYKKKDIPLLYGNQDVWQWIETVCGDLDLDIKYVDETIVQNFNNEPVTITLIQLQGKLGPNTIIDRLGDAIDDTKISLPWLDNHNLYASYENYQEVKEQLRIHKLTGHILETCDYKITWLRHSQMVKLIRLDCEIPQRMKCALKLNPNLFSVNLSFAYPWHQFWYFDETQQIDRLVLDVCANNWSSTRLLDSFDLIDLLQIQIAIRGPVENQYLYRRISGVIEQRIGTKSTQFNINTHLFDCDKAIVHEDTILYLIYQYGRHFKEIIWLHDFKGTELFDKCVRELNIKIRNHQTIELDLKRYSDLPEWDFFKRIWSNLGHFEYTINVGNYKNFTGDLFLDLIRLPHVQTIHIDVGYHLNYFTRPGNYLDLDELSAGAYERHNIRLTYKPRRTVSFYNGLNDFICFLKHVINSVYQQKYFHLILDRVVIDNWSIFTGLNILSIQFDNIELNINDMEELSKCTHVCSTLEFNDCENLNDVMLMKLIRPDVMYNRIKITGKTSITRLFFYMRAESRMGYSDSYEYDFADETPFIEMNQYDEISQATYYKVDDQIVCYDDNMVDC